MSIKIEHVDFEWLAHYIEELEKIGRGTVCRDSYTKLINLAFSGVLCPIHTEASLAIHEVLFNIGCAPNKIFYFGMNQHGENMCCYIGCDPMAENRSFKELDIKRVQDSFVRALSDIRPN